MTTFALAIVLVALLLIYCGVKGYSLRGALVGRAVPVKSGALLK